MEISYPDRRIARERLGKYLLEARREFASDWDLVRAVDVAAGAATDASAAESRHLLGLPADAPALDIATALQLLLTLRQDVDLLEDGLIKAGLERGMSWEQVGATYGKNTRQAMQQHAKRLSTRIEQAVDEGYRLPLVASDSTDQPTGAA